MKITSYEQLNKLIAQSLGWVESVQLLDQQPEYDQVEIEYYHPPNLSNKEAEEWFTNWGVTPDFSSAWQIVEEFLLPECDRRELLIEWKRSPQSIVCVIVASTEMYYPGVMVWTGKGFKYPRSMCLATCLAWLKFNGVPFSREIGDAILY